MYVICMSYIMCLVCECLRVVADGSCCYEAVTSKEVPVLRSALQRRTLPITSTKLSP
jgi:hypothetical protein